jgi:hypothetical protein
MSARERRHFGSEWENDRTLIGMIVLSSGIGVFCGALIGDKGTAVGYGLVGAGIGASAGYIINLTRGLFGLVASACKRQQIHRAAGEQLPTRLFGIDLGLFDRLPAEDRHQLMGGHTVLCGDGCAGLAEPVGASGHAGLETPLLEPGAQSLHRERPLAGGFQECQITQRRANQDRLKVWQDQDLLIDRLRAAILALAEGDPGAGMDFSHQQGDTLRLSNVRSADSRDVGNALVERRSCTSP